MGRLLLTASLGRLHTTGGLREGRGPLVVRVYSRELLGGGSVAGVGGESCGGGIPPRTGGLLPGDDQGAGGAVR